MGASIATAWIWWASAAVLGAGGLWLVLSGWLCDPDRRKRRCPKCWYDMTGIAGLRCPECGREAAAELRLFRRRRRWWRIRLGAVVVVLAAGLAVAPVATLRNLVARSPWTVVISLWPDVPPDGSALDIEVERAIADTLRPAELWAWQRRMLARRCAEVLDGPNIVQPGLTIRGVGLGPRIDVYSLIAELGPEAEPAVPALGRQAGAGSEDAARALRDLGPLASGAAADLIRSVDSTLAAMPSSPQPTPGTYITMFGDKPKGQASTITALVGSPRLVIPRAVHLEALAAIDGGSDEAVALCRRIVARDGLGLPGTAVSRFARDPEVRAAVLRAALDELAAAAEGVPASTERVGLPDRTLHAIEAIRILGADGAAAAPSLAVLVDWSLEDRGGRAAMRALAAIGPGAAAALPAVERAQRNGSALMQLHAETVAAIIRADDRAALDLLLGWMTGVPGESRVLAWDLQIVAAELLGELRVEDARIVPALESACDAGWLLIEKRATAALGARAAFDAGAVPALTRLLAHRSEDVRLGAALALADAGAGGKSAGPALRRALRDDNPRIRIAAATALARITGAAQRQ